ncbi:MAG: class I SAM-dependent methyltransferase [Candidatus Latescibacterota bacterium]|nr:MAG: class I SAM-dependent methyltransferase [Candidatus Latescibacterota bacterium]
MPVYESAMKLWNDRKVISKSAHWKASGHWKRIIPTVRKRWVQMKGRNAPERIVQTMVEYGSGGGAVASALAPFFTRIYGIDISELSLEEATKQLKAETFFVPVLIDIENPESALRIGPQDVFISTAVFQHLPSRDYARRVLLLGRRLVRDDGLALIQFRTGYSSAPKGNYKRRYAKWNCQSHKEFDEDARMAGWWVAEMSPEHPTRSGYTWAFMRAL